MSNTKPRAHSDQGGGGAASESGGVYQQCNNETCHEGSTDQVFDTRLTSEPLMVTRVRITNGSTASLLQTRNNGLNLNTLKQVVLQQNYPEQYSEWSDCHLVKDGEVPVRCEDAGQHTVAEVSVSNIVVRALT